MKSFLEKAIKKQINNLLRTDLNSKVQKRLFAIIWLDEGKSFYEVALSLRVTTRAVRQWLAIFRKKGLDELMALHYKGDTGNISPAQIEQLKAEIQTGKFYCARQVQNYLLDTFELKYSLSGTQRLLQRIGCSYHQITGFLFKASRDKQEEFVDQYHANQPKPGEKKEFTLSTPVILSGV